MNDMNQIEILQDRIDSILQDVETLQTQLEDIHQGGEIDLTESLELIESILGRKMLPEMLSTDDEGDDGLSEGEAAGEDFDESDSADDPID
jgi:hypothetical protein